MFSIGCTEKKIWFLIRHGTRFPAIKYNSLIRNKLPEIQKTILYNFNANKTTLNESEILKLAKWNISFKTEQSKTLSEEGENEMIDLAERFQSRFPNVLTQDYNNVTYKVKFFKYLNHENYF